jgi:hypothetical protein
MKYEVTYLKPKKKGYAKETATFLKIEDAFYWESLVKEQGAKEVIICPR